jgi:hypothetical protein
MTKRWSKTVSKVTDMSNTAGASHEDVYKDYKHAVKKFDNISAIADEKSDQDGVQLKVTTSKSCEKADSDEDIDYLGGLVVPVKLKKEPSSSSDRPIKAEQADTPGPKTVKASDDGKRVQKLGFKQFQECNVSKAVLQECLQMVSLVSTSDGFESLGAAAVHKLIGKANKRLLSALRVPSMLDVFSRCRCRCTAVRPCIGKHVDTHVHRYTANQ